MPRPADDSIERMQLVLLLTILTGVVLLVHGYHPYANDAGIYVAGVRKLLNPLLYRTDAPFVVAHTRLSIFAHVLAALVRVTRLPLSWVLLVAHLFSIYLFLWACWRLACVLFDSEVARWCSVLLAAGLFTLPVAGTALSIMDPYLTARSFSTPLSLLVVGALLERRWAWAGLFAVLCLLVHPLMGAYVIALLAVYLFVDAGTFALAVGLCGLAFAAAGVSYLLAHHASVVPSYLQVVLSAQRSFLFLSAWQWFEVVGLVAPLLLYGWGGFRLGWRSLIGKISLTCLLMGVTAMWVAACFVRVSGPYVLVPLQVLRSFHLIYAVGMVLLGGWMGLFVSRARWIGALLYVSLFAGMFWSARLSFAGSTHLELPGRTVARPWNQAFVWVRDNTPRDAVFAMEPSLVYLPGEDEQGFRAISERSALADDKDAGVVVVFPALTDEWGRERNATVGLNRMTDVERRSRLGPLGVSWLLLAPDARTSFVCSYQNGVVKVCAMP
jgi:hypothetical protein